MTIMHFSRRSADDTLQMEWNNCVEWASRNKLPLNISKCRTLSIVTKKNLVPTQVVSCDGSSLPEVSELKLLGVTFSSSLKWNTHVKNIISKASRRMYIIRNLKRSGCSAELIFRSYVSFIRSIILYAYPCFCNLPTYLQKQLVRIENRVLRIMNSDDLYPDLSSAAERACVKLFKRIEHDANHPLRTMFDIQSPNQTRSTCILRPPFAKTKRFYDSFIRFYVYR